MAAPTDMTLGRFDKSFLIHMIKDFFVVLLLVTLIEFGFKAGKVYWDYHSKGEAQALAVAEELADNIRAIMLNEGGPVAARTIYPILDKNWQDLGYEIAIIPSDLTVEAISENFNFVPTGIPMMSMAEATHKAASVSVEASSRVCIRCHTGASIGDELGTVVVRNYLARDFALWWEDVRLTLGLAVGKIVLHSFLLFLILRARMEPLLRLRAVVSALSKAFGSLDQRAEVRTADEFGVLARDLNVFLDRSARLIQELDGVLGRVVQVNDDIIQVQTQLRGQIETVVASSRALERGAMLGAQREPRLSAAWFDAARQSVAQLQAALPDGDGASETAALIDSLRAVVESAEAQIGNSEQMYRGLAALGDEAEALRGAMAEMMRLEERMKSVIDTGTQLVTRLQPKTDRAADRDVSLPV